MLPNGSPALIIHGTSWKDLKWTRMLRFKSKVEANLASC